MILFDLFVVFHNHNDNILSAYNNTADMIISISHMVPLVWIYLLIGFIPLFCKSIQIFFEYCCNINLLKIFLRPGTISLSLSFEFPPGDGRWKYVWLPCAKLLFTLLSRKLTSIVLLILHIWDVMDDQLCIWHYLKFLRKKSAISFNILQSYYITRIQNGTLY